MPDMLDAREMLVREFLPIRSRLLELAAALDRIEARPGDVTQDPRMQQVRRALELLCGHAPGEPRAERVQLIFSRPYRHDWQREMGLEV